MKMGFKLRIARRKLGNAKVSSSELENKNTTREDRYNYKLLYSKRNNLYKISNNLKLGDT